jgi:hypothetical protein
MLTALAITFAALLINLCYWWKESKDFKAALCLTTLVLFNPIMLLAIVLFLLLGLAVFRI